MDVEGMAETLKRALEMPAAEKTHRMARLQTHIAEHNIYKWLADIFAALARLQEEPMGRSLIQQSWERRLEPGVDVHWEVVESQDAEIGRPSAPVGPVTTWTA